MNISREVGNINLLFPIEINAEAFNAECTPFRDIGWQDTYENCMGKYLGMFLIYYGPKLSW